MQNEQLPFLKDKADRLTLAPGCYLMKDSKGQIIYVGKAKSLKKRVTSYFTNVLKHDEKTYRLVSNVRDFDFIVTNSEFEALILECSLIKQHMPRYNILLKDDKGYSYIKVSESQYPLITAEKQKTGGGTYMGPYTSSYTTKCTVEAVNDAFLLPRCGKMFPGDFNKTRPCLNFHIKKCAGVCKGKISKDEYSDIIEQVVRFIREGSGGLIADLTAKMNDAAENMMFERAAEFRDKIKAISKADGRQTVVMTTVSDADVVGLARAHGNSFATVLKFRASRLVDKEEFLLPPVFDVPAGLSEFIRRYYEIRDVSKTILLSDECEDTELISLYLSEKLGSKVSIRTPQKGEGKRLCEMAANNAAEALALHMEQTAKTLSSLDELAKLLGLPLPPKYIEAYDISNMGSDTVVGGMVVFEDGAPQKQNYRLFSIQGMGFPDDYAAMKEILRRRFIRYKNEDQQTGDNAFTRLPDLILLDGGKGHVTAGISVLSEMSLDIPLFGMVKDSKHRARAIAKDGGELTMTDVGKVFSLISKISEEVHRFTINYQSKKHSKKALTLMLTSIKGVGAKRANTLLSKCGSIDRIKAMTEEELIAQGGIDRKTAKAVFQHFSEKTQ